MKATDTQTSSDRKSGLFPTTHWSIVVAAQDDENPTIASAALSDLCKIYWMPVYAYIRSKGRSREDAEDITQDFFSSLLTRESFSTLQEEKGRLRHFLLVAVKRFLISDWEKRSAQKRGGGRLPVPLETEGVENRILRAAGATPEEMFDRQWALTLLQKTLDLLEDDYRTAGKQAAYDALKETITGDGSHPAYAEVGERLGISEGAARVVAHRLRRRYREILHAEIERTIDADTTVEQEIRHLFGVFSSS